jgi:uncharacterized YccA/Bax inhibitor family protein
MSTQMLNERTFATVPPPPAGAIVRTDVMTVRGTVLRAAVLLAIAVVAAAFGWTRAADILGTSTVIVFVGLIGLVVLSLVTAANPRIAPVTGPIYAAAMGVWAGAISALYDLAYDGIVLQAVFATFAVFLACLVLYVTRIVKVTDRFVFVVGVATGGILLMYIASWVLSLFGVTIGFLYDGSPLGILLSVGVCIVAALNLFVDFRFIEEGAAKGAPTFMAWYGAFALVATLIWLYLEMLRLLGRIRQ